MYFVLSGLSIVDFVNKACMCLNKSAILGLYCRTLLQMPVTSNILWIQIVAEYCYGYEYHWKCLGNFRFLVLVSRLGADVGCEIKISVLSLRYSCTVKLSPNLLYIYLLTLMCKQSGWSANNLSVKMGTQFKTGYPLSSNTHKSSSVECFWIY